LNDSNRSSRLNRLSRRIERRVKNLRRKKVCFVGYGSTEYSRKSEEPLLWFYSEAIRHALDKTGLKKEEIQGLSITTQASPDYSPHVAEQLGL
jgi:1,6-anhydro-N-acetylmuramate kinase